MTVRSLDIQVLQGSLLDVETQVIVNAANSYGLMGGGVAGVIRCAAGEGVEDEARRQAPIVVGHAILTSGGHTKFEGIIHAPTMSEPALRIPVKNVALAIRAALNLADAKGFTSLAIPGLGTGTGGVAVLEAASTMIDIVLQFSPKHLRSVVLVDIDPAMVQAWRVYL